MEKRLRLGILTPSSNTCLEPLSQSIVSVLPNITIHFSRFKVLSVGLAEESQAQFQSTDIIAAAQLLADAKVHTIGYSGTSAGWLGFENDERMCQEIFDAVGIQATTSVLALNKALSTFAIERFGLITPYTDDVHAAIVQNYQTAGIGCTEGRNMGLSDNSMFAETDQDVLDALVEDIANQKIGVVSTFCTNLRAAQRVEYWEKQHGIMVFDTVSTVIWQMLLMCGVHNMSALEGWGRLFQMEVATNVPTPNANANQS